MLWLSFYSVIMSDGKLIFPIGFDLESAVKNVEDKSGVYLRRLERTLAGKPITIKMEIDDGRFDVFTKAVKGSLDDVIKKAEDAKKAYAEAFNEMTEKGQPLPSSINRISTAMQRLIDLWNAMPNTDKFNIDGSMTSKAQVIVKSFNELTVASETAGRSLQSIAGEIRKVSEEEDKRIKSEEAAAKRRADILNAEMNTLDNLMAKRKLLREDLSKQKEGLPEWVTTAAQIKEVNTLIDQYKRKEKEATDSGVKEQEKVRVKREQTIAMLKAQENNLNNVNAKLRYYQQMMNSAQNQSQFDYAAKKVRELSEKLDILKQKIKDATTPASAPISQMPENSIANLTAKIQAYRNAMNKADFGSKEFTDAMAEVDKLTQKLAKMNEVVAKNEAWKTFQAAIRTATGTLNGLNTVLNAWQARIRSLTLNTKEWDEAALNIRKYSVELEQANQRLSDFQQKSLRGLGDNTTKAQIDRITSLRQELTRLDTEYNKLNANGKAFDSNGKLTSEANKILKERADYVNLLNEATRSADAAQQTFNTDTEKAKAKQQAHINELKKLHEALSANEQRIIGLNEKLQVYQQLIQKQQIGSDAWNKSALEIRRLTAELERANQQMSDFQQKAFAGINNALTQQQVNTLTKYRTELAEIDRQLHELRQNSINAGTLGDSATQSSMNKLLDERIAKTKQINEMLKSGADMQIEREKALNAETEKRKRMLEEMRKKEDAHDKAKGERRALLEAEKRRKSAGLLTEEQKKQQQILNSTSKSINAITAKLQYYRDKLNRQEFGSEGFKKTAAKIRNLTQELERYQKKIDELTGKTQSSSQKQTEAIRKANEEYRKQDNYLSRLTKRLAVYWSVSQVMNFLTNIREVTAQFELQRVSLGAIIQDQQRANELFSEIKAFALKSPLKILDLTKYTKQVAAYRIETDKLFDTTKRLADVSVGLGVDMGRIVLAYGQVKATSYLRAAEIRQFTEAGIPLLELLADKFTELQGSAVSTEEVMDKVSKRMVSFGLVEEIFKDMTDAGGIFYNMQEKQSQTLYGMWAKMGDAAAVMYDQIGNVAVVNGTMKGLIQILSDVLQHWSALGNVVQTGVIGFLAYKAAVSGLIPWYKLHTKLTLDDIRAEKLRQATNIRTMAIGRQLTRQEQIAVGRKRMLIAADYEQLLAEGKLSAMQKITLARQAANNRELRKALLNMRLFTKEQIRALGAMNAGQFGWAKFKIWLSGIGNFFTNIGNTIKSFLPLLALTTAFELGTDWLESLKAQTEAVKKVDKQYQETRVTLMEIENAYRSIQNAARDAAVSEEEFAKTSFQQKIEQLKKIKKILDNYGLGDAIEFTVLNPENIDQVADKWLAKLNEVNEISAEWGKNIAMTEHAFEANVMGWALAGENLAEDFKDMDRAYAHMTTDSKFLTALRTIRAEVDRLQNSNKDTYDRISQAIGQDAKLALQQKRRNESELSYQERIRKSYAAIYNQLYSLRHVMHISLPVFNAEDARNALVDFESELKEVMHELKKTLTEDFYEAEPMSIKMSIDKIAAEQEWESWKKEAIINGLNKIRLELELPEIPTDKILSAAKPVAEGMKSIIVSEFPGLFTENDLKSLFSIESIVEAIEGKLKSANEKLDTASRLQNNIGKGSEREKNVLAQIEKLQQGIEEITSKRAEYADLEARKKELTGEELKRHTELAEELKDIDDSVLQTNMAKINALSQQNEIYDKQIQNLKEVAKAEREAAKAALDRVTNSGLTSLGENIKQAFPQLLVDEDEQRENMDYSSRYKISDEELNKIRDTVDAYDTWAKYTKAIADDEKKLADVGISEVTVNAAIAAAQEKRAKAQQEIDNIEEEIKDKSYAEAEARYNNLLYMKSIAVTAEQQKIAEQNIVDFMRQGVTAEAAKLILRKQNLQYTIDEGVAAEDAQKQILSNIEDMKDGKKFWEEFGKYHNFKLLEKEKGRGGGSGEDPWIILMKNRMKFMQDFQKGVEELSKWMGATKGLSDEQENMLGRGLSLKIDSRELNGTKEELVAWYEDAIEQVRKKIAGMGGKEWEGLGVQMILAKDTKSRVIKKYQELLQEMWKNLTDFRTDQAQKAIEKELKDLADKVSKTKTAKEFYNKILSQTGDVELAANISLQLYGSNGRDLNEMVKEQMRNAFKLMDKDGNVYLTPEVSAIIDRGAYEELRDYISELPEAQQKAAESLIQAQQQMSAKQYELWLKDLEKAKDFADKRIELSRYTANQIAAIEDAISKLNPQSSDYVQQKSMLEKMIEGYHQRESKEAAKIEYDMFKDMPIYVQMFDDLDNASSAMLTKMLDLLKKNKEKWGGFLDPTQLKEMQSRMNEIESQLSARNPFKTLSKSLKEWFALKKSGRSRKDDDAAAAEAIEAQTEAYKKWLEAYKAYQAALKTHNNDTENEEVLNAKKTADEAAEEYKSSKSAAEAAQNQAEAWKEIADRIDEANQKIDNYQDQINKALDEVYDMMECFGVDAIDMEFFNSIKDGFNQILDGSQSAVQAFGQFASGNYFGAAMSSVSAITSIIGGISNLFTAGKVRKANKEIKRQQELLDNLEYAYSRLEKSIEKAFGADYINNFKQQQKNLEARADAYQKQADAERSKGKKADKDKIKEYENAYRDTMDEIADMQGQVAAQMLGTDITSAARDFAKAWIEAYKSFSNTAGAMKDKFREMIENMIVEGAMAKVMERALKPMFDMIDNMDERDFYSESFWKRVVSTAEQGTKDADAGASTLMKFLEQAGISVRELGGELTGTSRDVANASEESINGLAQGINTQNYYISQIHANVEIIARRGGMVTSTEDVPVVDYSPLLQQSLENQAMIVRNTSETLAECRKIASSCQEQVKLIRSVVSYEGGRAKIKT